MDLQIIRNLFFDATGYDLDSQINDGSTDFNKTNRFIVRQHKILDAYIRWRMNANFNYADLTEKQKNKYNDALIEQLLFTIENEDLSTWNGVDGSVVLQDFDLIEKVISPIAKIELEVCGIIRACPIW